MVETKKNEIRSVTSHPHEMLGKFVAERLLRTWKEDFIDEDTGEVVSIDRSELVAERGVLINGDVLSTIQFHLQAGDIKDVTVSNQKREACLAENTSFKPWMVTVYIKDKKRKFLLYAASVAMALEVVSDYVELNFSGKFGFLSVKDFESSIILKDTLKKQPVVVDPVPDENEDSDFDSTTWEEDDDSNEQEKKFYQIEVNVSIDDGTVSFNTFVVETIDVDRAMMIIKDHVAKKIKERAEKNQEEESEFDVKLETAKIIPCNFIISHEFSLAYQSK